jgi:hypothetical protein
MAVYKRGVEKITFSAAYSNYIKGKDLINLG